MKKLIGFLCCGFIAISMAGCAAIILVKTINTETDYRADEKGKQYIETWALNNITIGNSES